MEELRHYESIVYYRNKQQDYQLFYVYLAYFIKSKYFMMKKLMYVV